MEEIILSKLISPFFHHSTIDDLVKSLKRRFLSFLRKQESSIFIYLEFPGFPFSRE